MPEKPASRRRVGLPTERGFELGTEVDYVQPGKSGAFFSKRLSSRYHPPWLASEKRRPPIGEGLKRPDFLSSTCPTIGEGIEFGEVGIPL